MKATSALDGYAISMAKERGYDIKTFIKVFISYPLSFAMEIAYPSRAEVAFINFDIPDQSLLAGFYINAEAFNYILTR